MKQILLNSMLIASMITMTSCSTEDPFSGINDNWIDGDNGSEMPTSGGTSVSLSSYTGGNNMGGGGNWPGGWH